MEIRLRQRLIGGLVLAGIIIIIIPLFFKTASPVSKTTITLNDQIPSPPPKPAAPVVTVQYNGAADREVVIKAPVAKPVAKVEEHKANKVAFRTKDTAPAPKEKPVKVAKTTAIKPGTKAWVVQVGIFSSADNAKKLVKQLTARGFTAFTRSTTTTSGTTLTRVLVGPEVDRAKANALHTRLSAEFHLKGVIVATTT